MKQLFNDVINFIGSLSFNDIIFFAAVMSLIILAVTMMYLVKTSKYENDVEDKKTSVEEDLFGLISEEKEDELPPADDDEEDSLIDLKTIDQMIEKQNYDEISLDKYEEDQERKAIISYDELLQNTGNLKINYKEEIDNGIVVKEVDLENLTSINEEKEEKMKVVLMNYDKEEAFLKALKDLKKMLS